MDRNSTPWAFLSAAALLATALTRESLGGNGNVDWLFVVLALAAFSASLAFALRGRSPTLPFWAGFAAVVVSILL